MSKYIDADKIQYHTNNYCQEVVTKEDIDKLPTEDVVLVIHAHWVVDRYCSHCDCDIHDYDIYSKIPKYCPECGAKMDEKIT